jgi:23S rRNA (uracil1939-C5)-methyltransferase
VVVDATARGRFHAADEARLRAWLDATPEVAGMAMRGRGWTRTFGSTEIAVDTDTNAPPRVQRLGTFTQVNPAANRLLVRAVVDVVGAGAHVLDLFCGAGNLSLPLARVARAVVAVDTDAAAIADGAASAAAAGLANVRFEVGAADRFLGRHGLGTANVVVLDPPRTGARAVAEVLARLEPARIVYVSCEPSTLARDVRILVDAGYQVARVQPIDMFPQTEHVETVLEAVLTAP